MEWLTYLLKVSACTALFYAFYHFCLQRLTFFNVNRIYLLSTLIISFVIPVLQLKVERPASYSNQLKEETAIYASNFTDLQNPAATSPNPVSKTVEEALAINWQEVLFACYWVIVIVMLAVYAFQVLQLLKYARHISRKTGRLKVVFKPEGFTNCSFLNYVFVNQQELSDEEMAIILQHEQVHVSRYHSVDKLLIAAFKALLWFNPLIYLYDKALEQVHEYEADKKTSMTTGNTPYANVLLAIAVRKNNPALAHSFVRNPLKGRIRMLFTNPSKNRRKLMYLAALPIGLALIWTFAVQVVYASSPVPASASKQASTPKHIPAPNQTPAPNQASAPVQTQVKPVPTEKTSLKADAPRKEIQIEKPAVQTAPPDTLWMIDDVWTGKYAEVIIDGKSYDIDILTKISPRIISTISGAQGGKLEITTYNNKMEYATQIDRENVIIRNKALASGKIYTRYPQKSQDGSRYDIINIKLPTGGGGSVGLDKGKKLLLLIDGQQYSESKFKTRISDPLNHWKLWRFRSGIEKNEEIKAKYGKGYGSMIELFKPEMENF